MTKQSQHAPASTLFEAMYKSAVGQEAVSQFRFLTAAALVNEDTSGESGPRCQSAQLFSLFSQKKRPVTIKKNVLKMDSLGKVAESLYKDKLMACLPFQKDAAIVREIQLGSELNMQHNVCFYFLFMSVCLKHCVILPYNDSGRTTFPLIVSEMQSLSLSATQLTVAASVLWLWERCFDHTADSDGG